MKLKEVISILEAQVLFMDEELAGADIKTARASDLMSEILASVEIPDILLTGLANAQVVRTASVFGIKAVVIVRGKKIDQKIVTLAGEENITILATREGLFSACGKLYSKGVTGVGASA